ncbi:hypothetical protein [uncultured Helicobacter sp.]|uniref:hypothetical protein n=1 Tax=uncultured Helicobacter sp. TaxID=175537 RepID=UPI0026245BF7|nr:hypothetical protein [uncultured Helicobacter sp.]
MRQNFRYIFHFLIIAQIFCVSFLNVGCGFKGDPFNPKKNTSQIERESYTKVESSMK